MIYMVNKSEKKIMKKEIVVKSFHFLSILYALSYIFYIDNSDLSSTVKNVFLFFTFIILILNFLLVVRKDGRNTIKYLMYSFFLILIVILSYILFF